VYSICCVFIILPNPCTYKRVELSLCLIKHRAMGMCGIVSASIMSKFLLQQVTTLLQHLSWRTRVYIQGILPIDRLPMMANEVRLPIT
jgi:hypothetical protein